jgi:hypothetical protein
MHELSYYERLLWRGAVILSKLRFLPVASMYFRTKQRCATGYRTLSSKRKFIVYLEISSVIREFRSRAKLRFSS